MRLAMQLSRQATHWLCWFLGGEDAVLATFGVSWLSWICLVGFLPLLKL